ncbi:MAG: thioredoxin family protein [Lentisphaeria bacterium]|nr:thioredoxin family protein [Lentisphaeria bacterium]
MKKIWMLLITALLSVQFTAMGQPKPPQPPKAATKSADKGDTLPPKQAKWRTAPIQGWYIHYDEAVKAAKKANKKIFVLNAGSDWDGASVSLRKSVLDTRDFQQIAKRSLILLYLDTPQKFPQPEEQIRHHDIIRERLQMKGKKIPYAVIIDVNGKVITEINGVLPKKDYLDIVQKAVVDTIGHK